MSPGQLREWLVQGAGFRPLFPVGTVAFSGGGTKHCSILPTRLFLLVCQNPLPLPKTEKLG